MAGLKERNVLTLKDFLGVDYSSSPMSMSPCRAADSRNMILEDGVLHKRPGWRQIRDYSNHPAVLEQKPVSTRINGIHAWTDGNYRGFVVHIGNMLLCDYHSYPDRQGNSRGDLSYVWTKNGVTDAPSTMIERHGRIYIFCGGTAYVFPWYDPDSQNEPFFKALSELDGVYVPTTTVNINCEEEPDPEVRLMESPNLLTRWRKNTLVPRKKECEKHKEYAKGKIGANEIPCFSWRLDSAIEKNSAVTVTYDGVQYINIEPTGTDFEDIVETIGTGPKIIVRKDLYEQLKGGNIGPSLRGYLDWGTQVNANGSPDVTPIQTAFLNMYFDQCSHDGSEATVTFKAVEYGTNTREEKLARINGCTVATVFGAEGNPNRLFVSGNPLCPNRIFYSGYDEFTYFPDNGYVTAGSENSPVNGFLRLSDNSVAILKDARGDDYSLFYMKGELVNKYDSEGNLESGRAVFYVHNGGKGARCLNGRSAANLPGDPIMLSEEGVVGITVPANYTTVERFVRERSYSINPREIEALQSGHGIVYRGRYYLAVDDAEQSCFVADPKYRYYRDGNGVDQSHNYEWWHWNNIPARVWYEWWGNVDKTGAFTFEEKESRLLFGTADGRVCMFEDRAEERSYTDIDEVLAEVGSLTWDMNTGAVTFSADLADKIRVGNRIIFHDEELTERISPIDITWDEIEESEYFQIASEIPSWLAVGMRLKAKVTDEDSYEYEKEFDVKITELDKDTGKIRFEDPYTTDPFQLQHLYCGDRTFTVAEVDGKNHKFWVRTHETAEEFFVPSGYGTMNTDAEFFRSTTVRSYWITPYFDMGSALYGKTLLSLTLGASVQSRGLYFGYETKRRNGEFENRITGGSAGSMESFSFLPAEFTLENDFPATHTVRLCARNFNYIRFFLRSDTAADCSFHSLGALYKINRKNRGVR